MFPFEHGGDIYGGESIKLDFSVNVNPLGMPPKASEALAAAIPAFSRYPDPQCRLLRRALGEKLGTEPENILCGNGASDLIMRSCAALRPRRLLTLAPTFSEYARSAALFGGRTRSFLLLEREGFALTRDFLPALTEKTDMVALCNPNNPTGRLIERSLLREILDVCREKGVTVLLDECFLGFTEERSLAGSLSDYPNLLILGAFTKLYGMAGLRLGYLLGDRELLLRIAPYGAAWSVSAAAQEAGIGALQEPDWEEKIRALIKTERTYMLKALTKLGLTVFPSDSNFLLIKSAVPLWEPLKAKGLLLRACGSFQGLDSRFFRMGLKSRPENEALLCALQEVIHG